MVDMKKVANGVKHCFHGQECCGDIECPYYIEHLSDCCCLEECQENLKADIIALIKERNQRILDLLTEILSMKMIYGDPGKIVGELIRCKDCKYNDDGECIIKAGWFPVKPDWFCADGERRSE